SLAKKRSAGRPEHSAVRGADHCDSLAPRRSESKRAGNRSPRSQLVRQASGLCRRSGSRGHAARPGATELRRSFPETEHRPGQSDSSGRDVEGTWSRSDQTLATGPAGPSSGRTGFAGDEKNCYGKRRLTIGYAELLAGHLFFGRRFLCCRAVAIAASTALCTTECISVTGAGLPVQI